MAIDVEKIEARLRNRICPRCVRYTSDHRCSLSSGVECSLFANLARLIEIVRSTGSSSIGPYVDRLRQEVCAWCHEDLEGFCPFRDQLDCALDTYISMIVDEIEDELDSQQRGPTSTIDSQA